MNFPAIEFLQAVSMAVILIFGGYLVIDGNIEVGVLVLFAGYMQNFFDPIQQLSQLYTTYQAGMAALDKIFDLLAEEPDVTDLPGAEQIPPVRGAITFDDVWFSYAPDAREVIVGVRPEDLALAPGAAGALDAKLEVIEPVGNEIFLNLRHDDRAIVMRVPPQALPERGSTLRIAIRPERVHVFDARTERRIDTP